MKKIYVTIIIVAILVLIGISVAVLFSKNEVKEEDFDYEIAKIEQYNYFVLKQKGKYGVIDREANTVIEPEYKDIKIPNPEKAVFVCEQGDNIKVLNEKREEILTEYNKAQPIRLKNISSDLMYEKSVLKYETDGKYGLVDFEGNEITKPIYDEIDSISYKEGTLIVKQNEKYGVINIKGKEIVSCKYDEIKVDEYYTEQDHYKYAGYITLIKTQEGYRYGYLNYKGNTILDTQYNEVSRITEIEDNNNEYLICAKNGQYGVLKNKEQLIGNEYQSIQYDENNKIFVIEKSKKYGIANFDGKIVVPIQYNEIDVTGIHIYAKDEHDITVFDNNGTKVDMEADVTILNTNNEKYKIRINYEGNNKYGVISNEWKQLIEEKYNYIEYLYDDYFIVSNEDDKLGIIDANGESKVEVKYTSLQKIQNTDLVQLFLSENKITEIYSRKMEKVCEMKDATVEVANNFIKVYNATQIKYFSKEGKELKNTDIYDKNKLFVNEKNGKYGFVDKSGNKVVDYKYDKACEFNSYGFAAVCKNGKWGAIDEQGNEVLSPTYKIDTQKEPSFIGKYYQVIYGFGEFYYTDS